MQPALKFWSTKPERMPKSLRNELQSTAFVGSEKWHLTQTEMIRRFIKPRRIPSGAWINISDAVWMLVDCGSRCYSFSPAAVTDVAASSTPFSADCISCARQLKTRTPSASILGAFPTIFFFCLVVLYFYIKCLCSHSWYGFETLLPIASCRYQTSLIASLGCWLLQLRCSGSYVSRFVCLLFTVKRLFHSTCK